MGASLLLIYWLSSQLGYTRVLSRYRANAKAW